MKLDVDIDHNWVRHITVEFDKNEKKPRYTVTLYDGPKIMVIPITRAQMLNIIDDVTEAKRNDEH